MRAYAAYMLPDSYSGSVWRTILSRSAIAGGPNS